MPIRTMGADLALNCLSSLSGRTSSLKNPQCCARRTGRKIPFLKSIIVREDYRLNANQLLREEYSQFLDGVLDVLSDGGGVVELVEFLRSCEEQILTEAGDAGRRMAAAQAIANIYKD
jgi:hypothetical protein